MRFEKVSFDQFQKDCHAIFPCLTDSEIAHGYSVINTPQRATKGAAAYDFVSPFSFGLTEANQSIILPTGIRMLLDEDKALLLLPRSGLGFKTEMHLANTIGLIDYDYYFTSREGHIMAKVCYGSAPLTVNEGDRFMQGLIVQRFLTDDDNVSSERTGGFGSSGR